MSDDETVDLETVMEKREYHNAVERGRRQRIKQSFDSLREAVPTMCGVKTSNVHVLKGTSKYISFMLRKRESDLQRIREIEFQNSLMEAQIRIFEEREKSGNLAWSSVVPQNSDSSLGEDLTLSSAVPQNSVSSFKEDLTLSSVVPQNSVFSFEEEDGVSQHKDKKMKTDE